MQEPLYSSIDLLLSKIILIGTVLEEINNF